MKKDIIICADAGGTTSKIGIFTNDGNILMRETGKAGSPAVDKNWYLNIDSAIQKALDKLDFEYNILYIELGVSGISALILMNILCKNIMLDVVSQAIL